MKGKVENQSETVSFCPGLQEFWLWLRRRRRGVLSPGGGGLVEGVVCVHELLYGVLLQHHYVGQVGGTQTCAVLTVNHICLPAIVLTCHKQQIEHLHVTLIAVVGRLVFDPTLIGNLLACSNQLVS